MKKYDSEMQNTQMFSLKDKVIIITGGAGLIGSHFVEVCVSFDAKVVIADVDIVKSGKLVKRLKREQDRDVYFIKCDVNSEISVSKFIKTVLKKFGRIDALVNNAYPRNKNYGKKFFDVSYFDFCENINKNLGGYFLITREISKQFTKQNQGIVVNISSIYGSTAPRFDIYSGTKMTMPVEYAVVKAGVNNLTKYLASYLGKNNIRVNSISPGGIYDNQPRDFVKKYANFVKLEGRMANVDDVSGTLVFLLSDASKYITGQNVIVDGGFTL